MKLKFSKLWNASKQPRKQRKYLANAPLHLRQKMLSAHLSKDLRKKYSRRSFQVRKGDTVKIARGESAGKTGKIDRIDLKKLRVSIEGLQITKKDGSKANLYFNPSNLIIQELNLDDKERSNSINKETKSSKEKK